MPINFARDYPKLLLFRGSPRSDIERVEHYNIQLPCDVLIIRYTDELPAYRWARNYFLKHTEYDYLVLATDDIVVKPHHIIQLQEDLLKEQYTVLSGIMNVWEEDWPDGNQNICAILPNKIKSARKYQWAKPNEMPNGIFDAEFAGFGLMAIRRDVVSKFTWAGDGRYKGHGDNSGASLDFVFCNDCKENDISITVDSRIKLQHLRQSGHNHVGEKAPTTLLFRDGKELHIE